MKKVVRLNERELTRLIKNVVMENQPSVGTPKAQQAICKAEDSKLGSDRPFCTNEGITSGELYAMGDIAFIMYKDDANCPKICKVANKTKITLS